MHPSQSDLIDLLLGVPVTELAGIASLDLALRIKKHAANGLDGAPQLGAHERPGTTKVSRQKIRIGIGRPALEIDQSLQQQSALRPRGGDWRGEEDETDRNPLHTAACVLARSIAPRIVLASSAGLNGFRRQVASLSSSQWCSAS